jgi:hypothetical protein
VANVLRICLLLLTAVTAARAGKTVFVGSPSYTVTVQLSYTRQVDPLGEQGGFAGYTATGEFKGVRFGPAQAKGFEAWFQKQVFVPAGAPSRSAVSLPSMQVQGEGIIGPFTIAPAWEDPNEPIQPRITAGPRPFAPDLNVITFDMAHEDIEDSIPPVPLVPTVWFRYNESFSITEPELRWEYPDFAIGQVESGSVVFSVPLASLAQGEDLDIRVPYADGTARGEWKIVFWSDAEPAGGEE